jgi:AsmA protein
MTNSATPRPPRPRATAPREQRSQWLAIAGYVGLGLGCLVLTAATFFTVLAPVDLVRDRLVEQVRSSTGRDLVVSGGTSLMLFPRPGVSLGNVAFSAPPEMGGNPTVTIQKLEAELGLMSLLSGQPGVKRVVLTRPALELRVDAQGRRSWDIDILKPRAGGQGSGPSVAPAGQTRTGSVARGSTRSSAGSDTLAEVLEAIAPTSVRIVDGALRYLDERAGLRVEVESGAVDLALRSRAGPIEANGSFVMLGETVTFQGSLSQLRAAAAELSGRLVGRFTGRPLEGSYEGLVGAGPDGVTIDGNFSLKSASVQALSGWIGKPVAAGRNVGTLNVSSALTARGGEISLPNLSATLDDTSLGGALTVKSAEPRPHVSGTLKLSRLDLGGVLIRDDAAPAPATPGNQPTKVRGFTKRAEGNTDWSDDVIDLTPLSLADADLSLSADSLIYKDMKTGPTRLALKLKDRVANVSLEDMQLYGGRGQGTLVLDGSGQAPITKTNLKLESISALPLLKDALSLDWIDGRSTISIALTGRGVSERQIVEGLNGKFEMATADGAITGIDVGKILRGVEQGRFPEFRTNPGERTPFSELAGSFTITNGVAENKDLRVVSPDVRVTGAGTFNLAARTVDYTVRPKIASVKSNTDRAVINLSNLEIPVRVEGSWEKPNFSIAGQDQILDAIRQIGKNLKSQDVEEALKGILGGGDGQPRAKPRDILEKLFKKP